jgi:hypothetical protein
MIQPLYPRQIDTVPAVQVSGPFWMRVVWTPNRSAHSESLRLQLYPGPFSGSDFAKEKKKHVKKDLEIRWKLQSTQDSILYRLFHKDLFSDRRIWPNPHAQHPEDDVNIVIPSTSGSSKCMTLVLLLTVDFNLFSALRATITELSQLVMCLVYVYGLDQVRSTRSSRATCPRRHLEGQNAF